jgi:hypothetical protein
MPLATGSRLGPYEILASIGAGAAKGVNGDQADNSIRDAGAAYLFVR